jgi:hypothetical protein
MRASAAFVVLSLVLSTALAAQEAPKASAPGACQRFTSRDQAFTVLRGYLDRMKLASKMVETADDTTVLDVTLEMENATHHLRIVVDTERDMVYLFLNRYLTLPKESPSRNAVFQELMQKNWDLNIGEFEWDPSDGEVRLSYTFTTENGLGYEAFEAIVGTLAKTGDRLWPELKAMTTGG